MSDGGLIAWISVSADLVTACAVAAGVWIAFRQLTSWQDETITKKRAEIAEQLLATALEISDALRSVRSVFDSVPQEEVGNKLYPLMKRHEGLQKINPTFKTLRALQVRANAVLDEPKISEAVEKLFDVRATTAVALEMLADRGDIQDEDSETKKMYQRMRKDVWGSYTEKHDPLGMKQLEAVQTLEELLQPIVRLEYGKTKK